jgi:uncharacterized protein (UPF0332 family)
MDPSDFLDTANDLAMGSRESDWRSAVSRAYYALFHLARQLLVRLGFHPPDGERVHGYVWLRVGNCGHPELAESGQNLNQLRRTRNWADYDLDHPMDHGTAWRIVDEALITHTLLRTVAGEQGVLTQITQAMRDYERNVLGEVTWRL